MYFVKKKPLVVVLALAVKQAVRRVWSGWHTYRMFRRDYVHLLQYDAHLLKDIGVDRDEIRRTLRRAWMWPLV